MPEEFSIDEMAEYGLDPNEEDYREWLLSDEGRAVAEEMFEMEKDDAQFKQPV